MIPKIIHYCWFGNNPKTKYMKKCMASWKKYCPDYEIKEWNESNFDVNCIAFVKEAYEARKWAFVTDYARLKIIYENGGIYLDTDVELVKNLDSLLSLNAYVGMQSADYINTGLGFGAEKGSKMIFDIMNDYDSKHFISEKQNELTCPILNTAVFVKHGFISSGKLQIINGVTVLPVDYLNPMDSETYKMNKTANTYSIHHYSASWKKGNFKIKQFVVKTACLVLGEKSAMKIKLMAKNIHKR